jgi:hypothetical protein
MNLRDDVSGDGMFGGNRAAGREIVIREIVALRLPGLGAIAL